MTKQIETPQDAEAIFQRACQLKGEAQAKYLDDACGGDAELRGEIRSMIEAQRQQGEFLSEPTSGIPSDLGISEGMMLGPYKLLQKIGEGGFGLVYMADQQEPVARKVAVTIQLVSIGHGGAVVTAVAETVAVAVRLVWVVAVRAVVLIVGDAVGISVVLVGAGRSIGGRAA